ncbi:MAG: hypothetical protein ACRD9R_18175 [Pyrinomonadaceae bacterium]
MTLQSKQAETKRAAGRPGERGAALALALIIMALLAVISISVMAVVNDESRVSGSDLCRTQTFYAAAAGIEKMTSDFSALFVSTANPTDDELAEIAAQHPEELEAEGFSFPTQTLERDETTLTRMRLEQNITNGSFPRVTIPDGPFAGLTASVAPYILRTIAQQTNDCGAEVQLERTINNYLIPIFQFGIFGNEDIELHPGPAFSFNGRVHANGNIYVNGNVTFLAKVTTANEMVRDVLRNGSTRSDSSVKMKINNLFVPLTVGSVNTGPNFTGARSGQRGYFPSSPNGSANTSWETASTTAPRSGDQNRFGGQLLTRTTGIAPLLLPLQLNGSSTREIIKRRMPNDSAILSQSRYHSKAQIRILIDDEQNTTLANGQKPSADTDRSGIVMMNPSSRRGELLSSFVPTQLGGGKALWRVSDSGSYLDDSTTAVRQQQPSGSSTTADTVRGIRTAPTPSPNGVRIPGGAGVSGRILIEIIDSEGNARDVTEEILSMGMTVGEPNAIVQLQRPLWAAFTQGSRDNSNSTSNLVSLVNPANGAIAADGEIAPPTFDGTYSYVTNLTNDTSSSIASAVRGRLRSADLLEDDNVSAIDCNKDEDEGGFSSYSRCQNFKRWNKIVPINVYNIREGRINHGLTANAIYERGMTSVIELNMRNLARWVDGVYDTNLLASTEAVSANIDGTEGYVVYVSDRRGDRIKSERDSSGATLGTTNGMADNEDIYGPNGSLDPGEDVIDSGFTGGGTAKKNTLQKDTSELPDPATLASACGSDRQCRAREVANWNNSSNLFRRAVRLFNGEDILLSGASGKLSNTKGLTVASENMVYIWGNYNTTGINARPPAGTAALNDCAVSPSYCYQGDQIPASIVADAFFPLSKTWFDSAVAIYPDALLGRPADKNLTAATQETSVRAGIIAGITKSALAGTPDAGTGADSRLSGGVHNFPRFLEDWLSDDSEWNFSGSLIPLFYSTQAMGPWQYPGTRYIYGAPIRDWSFDTTFTNPMRLPPGTPLFQYIEPTGFKQVIQ